MASGEGAFSTTPICRESAPETRPGKPHLLILSDIRLLCEGLVLALSQESSLVVLGSSDLSIGPDRIAEFDPSVLLLDIGMSGGLDACLRLRKALPCVKIVALAVSDVEADVIACAMAGVSGFVSRTGSAKDLVAAVHSAVRGEMVCSPRTTALLFNHVAALSAKSNPSQDIASLTDRELEITSLMTEGLSNKEIARFLRIQNATVKNHGHTPPSKLRVRRRGEAAAHLRKIGLNRSRPPVALP